MVETVVPFAGDFSETLVGLEVEALGLSSSKFFFNHLDGKHMVGMELAEGRGGSRGRGVRAGSV